MFKKRVLALFVILQVVVTILFPASAYAATYAPVVDRDWNSTSYCVSGVSNRFDAALGLIGQWGKKIQISNEMYVKLSNESSGGAFWTLADSMVNPVVGANRMATAPEGWGLGPISTVLWLKIVGTCWAEYGSPADWMWCTSVNQELIDNANRDFLKVLNGESLGGDGGGNSTNFSGFYHYINSSSNPLSYYLSSSYGASGVKFYVYKRTEDATSKVMAQPFSFSVNFNNADFSDFDKSSYDAFASFRFANGYITDLQILLFKSGSYTVNTQVDSYDSSVTYISSVVTSEPYYVWNIGNVTGRSDANYTCDGSSVVCNVTNVYTHQTNSAGTFDRRMFLFGNAIAGGGGGDNHWPEPTTPEPDPPTNTDPPLDPPNPPGFTLPDIDLPDPEVDLPITIVPPDNTTAADYTPWLRAILTALNTIIDDMGEHCDHIRVAMRDYLNGLYEALSDDLQAYYDDLTDYMSDLAKWIVSHLNFDVKQPDVNVNVPGYDDSSVIGWLRRIYYKLRGTGTPRPDPIEDTDGALDWWAKFLEWITNALGGLLTDFVGDLGGFLQELIDTFPFSIPWDIVAMLTLLDAQRATPDFTVTIPAQEGWWDDITVRIELSAYNDAMATVRGMVMIWWMYILVMKTDWMMLLFDGANNAISDFVSRLTGKG